MFWLVTVPSGFISDKIIPEEFGIVLIKSPRTKRNFDPLVLLQDSPFCVEKLDTDLLCLKQNNSDDYYEKTQIYMGLSGVSYAEFVYYTFNGLVIVRVKFDKAHFQKLIVKLNSFCKDYVVPQVLKNKEIFFFHKKMLMFANEKQSNTTSFTLFTLLKTIYFFSLTTD